MNRASSFVSAALLFSIGACASPGGVSIDGDYELSEERADGIAQPLRNRATWKRRLDACKSAFDAQLAADPSEGDSLQSVYDDYKTCLAEANDRALGRIGRLLAEYGTGETGIDGDTAIETFAATREASDAYCTLATGFGHESIFDEARFFDARFELTRCVIDNEIDLAQRIGQIVKFEDVSLDGDWTFDVSHLRIDDVEVAPASAPVCAAAARAAAEGIEDHLLSLVYRDELACVENGTNAAIADAVAQRIAPQLLGEALDEYVASTKGAFDVAARQIAERCLTLSFAGHERGQHYDTVWTSCATESARRLAGYIDRYAPIAADPDADPDGNGIPGDQSGDSDGAAE